MYPLKNQLRDAVALLDDKIRVAVVEEENLNLTAVLFP